MKKIVLFFLVILSVNATYATGLSGTYTIDPAGSGSTNYTSFRAAVRALTHSGVSGAVIFNVADGTYSESLNITAIKGTSSKNTVTFQSASLDSTKVVLDTSDCGNTVYIDGASYLTFREMTISASTRTGTAGDVFQLNGAKHFTLENNILHYNKGNSIPSYEAVVDADNPNNNYHTIRNNHITGGYYGIEHDPGSKEIGNTICNNLIDSVIYCAINMNYQEGMKIYKNTIVMPKNSSVGINALNCLTNGKDSSCIYNNFISNPSDAAIYLSGNEGLSIYYNSFFSAGSYTVMIYNYGTSTALNFINNAVINLGKGIAMIVDSPGALNSDYNDLYSTGILGVWNTTNCLKLAAWKTASGQDKHSVSGNPRFANVKKGDLHATTSSAILDKGATPLNAITDDIDGQARSLTRPDIGADEVNRDSNDVGVASVIIPAGTSCGGAMASMQVKIHNYGMKNQVNNFNIHVVVSGGATASVSQAFTDTLHSGQDSTLTISFSPALNTSAGGVFNFQAYTDLSGDYDNTNDSAMASDSFYALPAVYFSIGSGRCVADSFSFTDSSTSAASWNWYFGDGTSSTTQNPRHLYSATGVYTVQLNVTSPNGCPDSSYRAFRVDSCYNILSGKVSTSTSAALKNSLVYAVHYDSADTTLIILARTTTDSAGNYSFSLKDSVVYLVAYPDSATYPHEVVTWRDTALAFQDSKAVRMAAPSNTVVNFYTLSGVNNSGTGFIGGKVTFCMLCKQGGSGTPAAGIKLILVNNKGICYGITQTDFDGNFSFGKLALQDYYIWVDKPMVNNTVSPLIALKAGLNNQANLKFTLYPTYLAEDKTTGISALSEGNSLLRVFPNPFQSSTNISYSLERPSGVSLEVYDLLGKRIATLINTTQSAGAYKVEFNPQDYDAAKAGMYLVKMRINGSVAVKEIILTR